MKLAFRHFGEGRPLIILHGLFGQSDNWTTVAKRLAVNFSVYIPDQRNHGHSAHSPVLSYPALSDDLLEFMAEQGIRKTILIGHSMGGKVAMTFALEHPEMVEKLVIIDISPRKYPERNIHSQVITQMMSIDLGAITTRTQAERILEERVPDARLRQLILKNLYYIQPGKLGWRPNLESINENMDLLFDEILIDSEYWGPCLFIRGSDSNYITQDDIPLIRGKFPTFGLETISGASHWVHADAPEELISLLKNFLESDNQKLVNIPRQTEED